MGRVLGVDYGDVRIGLSVSDKKKIIALPLKTIINSDSIIYDLKQIIIHKDVESIVVGIPIGMNGNDTKQTTKVREFSESLSILCLPVYMEDERLSSVAAEKSLYIENIKTGHNKEIIDKRAATIILQQFLDRTNFK